MRKEFIKVPKGIEFITDWSDYDLSRFNEPHILNKTITGCGYTEYCIRNGMNIILCSPRKILLENKEEQHQGEVYYVKNEVEKSVWFEKDLNIEGKKRDSIKKVKTWKPEEIQKKILELKDGIRNYWNSCKPTPFSYGHPCKILVTYDSFRHVKEVLGEDISQFYIVIDEFQSIFTDAKFKPDTELEFVRQLQGFNNVCYVSATPMLEQYLDEIPEFKDLPYYELDWVTEEPERVRKPRLEIKSCSRANLIQAEIKKIISKYREGFFETYRWRDDQGNLKETVSNEAVFYVNSVKDIVKAIRNSNLRPEEVNILVSRSPDNQFKIREAFMDAGNDVEPGANLIGRVPGEGEKHKMFTFCTRTVYLGADFYSTCARTFIFSNANVDSLSVDISLDLPQILGRQRLKENPWKNDATLYITLPYNGEESEAEFAKRLEKKQENTDAIIRMYSKADDLSEKRNFERLVSQSIHHYNYKDDYVSINQHAGSDVTLDMNNLVYIAEKRAYDIQKYDYVDRVTILSRLEKVGHLEQGDKDTLDQIMDIFKNKKTTFIDRMKFLEEVSENVTEPCFNAVLKLVPMEYGNYIITLGFARIKTLAYKRFALDREFKLVKLGSDNQESLAEELESHFSIGCRYTKADIKETLKQIYKKFGMDRAAKASDLKEWFELKTALITNQSGKRDSGFEILGVKER